MAKHDALKALPLDRHQMALGKPIQTYRDLPSSVQEAGRAKGSSIELPMPSLQEMEGTMPPQTAGTVLKDYLRAAKELLSGH